MSIVQGTFSSSKTTITSTNYTQDDLIYLYPLTNFSFQQKQIVSFGSTPLNVSPISNQQTLIQGYIEPLAQIKIDYQYITNIITADNNGLFKFPLDTPLPLNTVVTLTANSKNRFLYQTKEIIVLEPGSLILTDATKIITFLMVPYSVNPILCSRNIDLFVTVTDTRIQSTDWELYANIDHNLISKENSILKEALIYIDINKIIIPLSTLPTLVYSGQKINGTTKITKINWAMQEGIILKINNALKIDEEYIANITWTIKEKKSTF